MSLEFVAAGTEAVFGAENASSVSQEIFRHFGLHVFSPPGEPYCSEQLPWSGCQELFVRAQAEPGAALPQLAMSPELRVVYLPITAPTASISYNQEEPPLYCGSLSLLREELNQFAFAVGLPTDQAEIDAYWQRPEYQEDEGHDIETYCHLQLAVYQAIRRKLPLWIVR